MVEIESFLAIEATLHKRVASLLREETRALYAAIETSIKAEDFDTAEAQLQSLEFQGLLEGQEGFLSYMTDLAMLFGASRVSVNPGTSAVGLGIETPGADTAIATYTDTVTRKAKEFLQRRGSEVLVAKRDLLKDAPIPDRVLKAVGIKSVIKPFSSFMDDEGDAFMNIASSLHTSRLSAYGFTVEADVLGVNQYRINEQLDTRICPVCRIMHGKKFPLGPVKQMLDVALRVSDPAELKDIQPWPKQTLAGIEELRGLSNDELVARNILAPPFHPLCRGLLAMVDKVKPLGAPTGPKKATTPEEFSAIGRVVKLINIKRWDAEIGTSPSGMVATLRGMSQEEFLAGVSATGADRLQPGVSVLAFRENDIRLNLMSKSHGSTELVSQKYLFNGAEKTMTLKGLRFSTADNSKALLRKHMRGMLAVTREIEYTRIATLAQGGDSVHAMVKYGWVPSSADWDSYRTRMLSSTKTAKVLVNQPDDVRLAFNLIVGSEDPKNIFLLSDLTIGKRVMKGTSLDMALSINDRESMARFLSFMGEPV